MEERGVRERAIKLVEALLGRAEARFVAQMPFANGSRGVAEGLEPLGDCCFVEGQTLLLRDVIELVSEARLIAAR